ncbi:hypothetical protein ACHAXS_013292 [Conticribra weissflogii]
MSMTLQLEMIMSGPVKYNSLVFVTALMAAVPQTPSALEVATMKHLVQNELDTLRPFSLKAFMDLWADEPGIKFCVENGCYEGKEIVHELMDSFGFASIACDMDADRSCHFFEYMNKAACTYSCNGVLLDNPGCVTDDFTGIIAYEWNDDGLLVRIDEMYSIDEFETSLAPCMKVDRLASVMRDNHVDEARITANRPDDSAIKESHPINQSLSKYFIWLGLFGFILGFVLFDKTNLYTRISN